MSWCSEQIKYRFIIYSLNTFKLYSDISDVHFVPINGGFAEICRACDMLWHASQKLCLLKCEKPEPFGSSEKINAIWTLMNHDWGLKAFVLFAHVCP